MSQTQEDADLREYLMMHFNVLTKLMTYTKQTILSIVCVYVCQRINHAANEWITQGKAKSLKNIIEFEMLLEKYFSV